VPDPEVIRLYEGIRVYIEYTSAAAGAISGALHAQRRKFDFVGVVVIGVCSGLGGGIIRDILLGQGPVLALRTPNLLVIAIVASLVGAMLASIMSEMMKSKWVLDSITLGLFAVAGLTRAEAAGLELVPCLLLGVVTCVGGGVIRDVLCRETPDLLLPGQPYSLPALLAGMVYMTAIRGLGFAPVVAELLAIAAAFVMRMTTAYLKWEVPIPPDLPHEIRRRWIRKPPPDKPNT
jgi:uncharacterized membrane protein YeiH